MARKVGACAARPLLAMRTTRGGLSGTGMTAPVPAVGSGAAWAAVGVAVVGAPEAADGALAGGGATAGAVGPQAISTSAAARIAHGLARIYSSAAQRLPTERK